MRELKTISQKEFINWFVTMESVLDKFLLYQFNLFRMCSFLNTLLIVTNTVEFSLF